ncbi:hypothetical protein Tco_0683116 [Tanacetum coccineum]|uniref:Xylulose kinase-1 n=1 Tax=Tanacetum coccineum TaxID=301880 RepID=A0ABQ4XUP0_9ASTR
MTTLKFADTHNMVAFLSKPTESEGFEQIVDFLNANPISYALTINPTIYISCIEQFWSTVKAKTVNGEVQLQALVDGKKIIITESTVRRDLQLEDAEGVDYLPNATIFEQLTLMSSKTTAWNEFSSTMASAIICLATNQKFKFSKYIFESMVKNLDNAGKFLMYPRPRKPKRKDTEIPQSSGPTNNVADEAVNEEMDDSLERAATTSTSLDAEQDRGGGPRCQKTIGDTIAQTRFKNISKTSNDPSLARANQIASLKRRVKKLERRNRSRTHGLKRMYRVGSSRRVESFENEGLGEEDASKQGRRTNDIDADEDITLVNDQDDDDMFGVNDLDGDEVIVDNVDVVKTAEEIVNTATTTTTTTATITDVKVTLAQALTELKSAKPKAVKVVIQEPEQGTTTTTPTTIISVPKPPQDKGKRIMIEEHVVEQVKPMKIWTQLGPYTPTMVTTPAVVPQQRILTVIPAKHQSRQTAQEMRKPSRVQQGESLNIQDVKTNLFWEFGQFTSHDGETIESYYTRFYKMMNEMIRNNLTVATMQVNVQFPFNNFKPNGQDLSHCEATTQLDEVSYHKLFRHSETIPKGSIMNTVLKRMAKNAKPISTLLLTTVHKQCKILIIKHQTHKTYAPTSKASLPTRSHAATRYKGKEIAKPITPPSESASEEDSDPEQAQKDKDMQKNLALIAKCAGVNKLRKAFNFKQSNLTDWLADTDEEIDEQELEAHYSYMAKIQEVPNADSGTDAEPLEQVHYDTDHNVFANDLQHLSNLNLISNHEHGNG